MGLQEQIQKAMVQAMRDKKEPDLSVLRLLKTAITNREIELRKNDKELDEAEVQKTVKSQAKQLKDALSEFEAANREDLVAKTKEELEVLANFLPKELSDDEIRVIIKEVIEQTDSPAINNCMGVVMQKVAGRADGARVRQLLQDTLGS